jgi:RNA polymerase sigma-70 factor (ECF subfamily)
VKTGRSPRGGRLRERVPHHLVVGEFGEVFPRQDERACVVPACDRGSDLLALAFASAHTRLRPASQTSVGALADVTPRKRPVKSAAARQRDGSATSAPGPTIAAMMHGDKKRDHDFSSEDGLRRAAVAYGPELRAYAARQLRSWSLAEDLVQETFLRAWRAAERFDATRGTARAWLYAILRNVVIDHTRAQARRPFDVDGAFEPATNDAAEAVVTALALNDALRHLTAQHREVIYHGHLRERTHHEIAQLLDVPVGTVRSRLHYARQALRRAMADA